MNPNQQPSSSSSSSNSAGDYWGTHVMGTPVPPATNQHAPPTHNPYVQYGVPQPPPPPQPNNIDNVRKKLNSWGNKAEIAASNIWTNLKAGQSVTGSAWGKVNLTAKALTEGGFESLYKQNFTTYPNEKLVRTFACYLSTSTGPVAGTLYLSNIHVAFCSDRPLSSIQPNGMESWIHYKVIIPLEKVATVNPVTIPGKKQTDKYIQLSTIDAQDFWFMGFVNHEKASKHLLNGVSTCVKSVPFIP
uniref:GEM-like protein 5 n=1 Tax=Erigeron canadensis TaxID=72917 RepID=UPI001CB943F5|nr:GEM-like protein 5 [Erigeron canadensis]